MKATSKSLALAMLLLPWIASHGIASSLTLDTAGGIINHLVASDDLIAGSVVYDVFPQPASFEAFHWWDKNNDGVWNGPDARRRASGSYEDGLFRLYSLCQSLGAFSGAHQHVDTQGKLLIDDLIVSTSDPSPPATIPVTLSYHVSGALSHYNSTARADLITAALNMRISFNGSIFTGEYRWVDGGGGHMKSSRG